MVFWTVTVCHGRRLFHNRAASIAELFRLLWSDKLVSFVVFVGDETIRRMLSISMRGVIGRSEVLGSRRS
jgi:hypothetical protein